MTRQEAYVAELSQLLFYMTPWDKAAALKHVNKRFAEAENEAELMDELGTPMKLAVTLHRSYEPTPEPTAEELAAREAAEAAEAAAQTAEFEEKLVELTEETESAEAEEEVPAEEPAAQEDAPVEEPAAQEDAPVEEPAAQEDAPVEEPAAQEDAPAEEPAAQEEAPAEEPAALEEAPAEEPAALEEVPAEEPAALEEVPAEETAAQEEGVRTPWVIEEKPEKEQIFAEIFNAATEAQSAVVLDEPKKQTKRKARYLLLIPYTIFAILVGVPGTLVFAAANLAVMGGAAVSLVAMVYLVIFHLFAAVDLGSKLILLGLSVVMLALTVILAVFAIWFLHSATLGFPRFLRETAMKHCYREVEVK